MGWVLQHQFILLNIMIQCNVPAVSVVEICNYPVMGSKGGGTSLAMVKMNMLLSSMKSSKPVNNRNTLFVATI